MNQFTPFSFAETPKEFPNPSDAKESFLISTLQNNEFINTCQKENFTCRLKNFLRYLFN
jgi:hypothetical protein